MIGPLSVPASSAFGPESGTGPESVPVLESGRAIAASPASGVAVLPPHADKIKAIEASRDRSMFEAPR
jgi:hypothetical protein